MPMMALASLTFASAALAGGPPGHLFTRVYGPADGIVGGQIRALTLDDDGALIVGTEGGVCRFDGQSCARVVAPPGFERSFVTELLWHDGALYVATRGGVYRVREGRATLLFEQASAGVTSGFAADNDGSVWIALESGLWRVEGDTATQLVAAPELGMRAVAIDEAGVLVGATTGVYRWGNAALTRLSDAPVRAFLPDESGVLFGSEAGVVGPDGATLPGSGKCYVTDMARLPDQRLVASCGEGMILQEPGGDFERIGRKNGLPASILTRVAVDRDGQIWLGTLEHGLVRVANPDLRLWDTADGFLSPHITAMAKQGEHVYVATRHGAIRVGPDLAVEPVAVMGKTEPELRTVAAMPGGGLVWSWANHGLVIQENGQERLIESQDDLGHVLFTGPDALVGVTWDQAFQVALRDGTFEALPPIDRGDGADMVVDGEGRVTFTARSGLLALSDGAWTRVDALPAACSNAELLIEAGATWFGCEGVLYRKGEGPWRVYARYGEGTMFAQLSRLDGALWLVTLDGLTRVEPRPLRIQPESGLPQLIFLSAISPQSIGDWLLVATSQGLLSLRAASFERPRRSPDARILSVYAGDRRLDNALVLRPDEDLLRVELGADTLGDPTLVRFRFRLDEGEWSEPLDGATLFLPGLPHGEHTLSLQARYADSPWSARATVMPFRILPHWHERRAVQLSALAALFAGVLFLRSERTQRLREELKRLEEREAFRQVFGRFVDPHIADEALSGRLNQAGEKRDVTILFADIQGFTPMTEAMEPHALVALLNRWLTAMVAQIEREGGVVNKFAGDAVVAIFGAPLDQPDHADRAVRAAMGMCEAGHALADELERSFGRRIRAGIGVNSGEVIAGPVGAASRMEYTVIGEAVNVAARVEALTRALDQDVLVTEATRKRLSGTMSLQNCGTHTLKGVSHPVQVWGISEPTSESAP